jgi:hypothetical protein
LNIFKNNINFKTISHTAISKVAFKLRLDDEITNLDLTRSNSTSFDQASLGNASQSILSPPTNEKIKSDDKINADSLKSLELLFNEVAMAYISDKKSLEQSIYTYQEKYHKADYMINLLFDNLNMGLNVK